MAGTSPAMTKNELFFWDLKQPEIAGRFFGHAPQDEGIKSLMTQQD
jgi:hypothetical protein